MAASPAAVPCTRFPAAGTCARVSPRVRRLNRRYERHFYMRILRRFRQHVKQLRQQRVLATQTHTLAQLTRLVSRSTYCKVGQRITGTMDSTNVMLLEKRARMPPIPECSKFPPSSAWLAWQRRYVIPFLAPRTSVSSTASAGAHRSGIRFVVLGLIAWASSRRAARRGAWCLGTWRASSRQ